MNRVPNALSGVRRAVAGGLARLGARPDHLTIAGLAFGVASGYLFYLGRFRWASTVLVLSALCDLFDGEVARVSGRTTRFGAFLDSTLDRLSDAAVIGGIMLYYASLAADRYVVLALAALLGAFLTSYTRARAESLIDRCDVGLFERPERLAILIIGGLAGRVTAALWVLTVAGNLTVIQRIAHVRLALKAKAEGSTGGNSAHEPG